ncbi:MAG: class I SAM-dependent methyltransferase, partial [Ignavibacteria bacterium]
MSKSFSFDELSNGYQARYSLSPMPETKSFLNKLIHNLQPSTVCELGCGTCYWIGILNNPDYKSFGIDISLNMLKNSPRFIRGRTVCGDATILPFQNTLFDLMFMVNVIHLIPDKDLIFREVYRTLNKGGIFAIIFADVHDERYINFIFDCFNGTKERSLKLMPTVDQLRKMFEMNLFSEIKIDTVEIINATFNGAEVFNNPYLRKNGSSTL